MLDSSGNVWGFGNNLLGEAGRATPAELLYAAQVTKSATITDYLRGRLKNGSSAESVGELGFG